jgi:hypothetical protein
MPSLHYAESMLCLVTSRERAGAIVGDLAERAVTRGVIWLWSAALRAAVSLLWYDIVGHPAQMAGVVLRAFALDLGLVFLFGVLSFVIIAARMIAGGSGGAAVGRILFVALPMFIFPLVVGRALAYWAPGHELAAVVVFVLLSAILNLIVTILAPGDAGLLTSCWADLRGAAQDLPLVLAGSMWGRHRNLIRRQPPRIAA